MKSIRLKNLRSFKDSGDVPIKDINLFVGQNSSGKSSFLRTFPLLRQSILRDTRGPILWYDDTLVDFGSYAEAKNRYAEKTDGIIISFKINIKSNPRRYFFYDSVKLKADTSANIDIEVFEKARKNYIGKIALELEDQKILIEANNTGQVKVFSINDTNHIFTEGIHSLYKVESSGIIPMFFVFNKNDKHVNREYYSIRCKQLIKGIIGNRLRNETRIDKIINDVTIGSKQTVLNSLKNQSTITTWKNKIASWNIETPAFIEINNLLIANYTSSLLNTIDENLKTYFEECKYIAPIRAKAIRYYRRQDLSVSEVDAYGDNLHMFLDNLNSKQMESYQAFVKKIFGFTPLTESSQGHITINVKDENGEVFNLTDLGFGYSQILPIITKLWYAFSSNDKKRYWESKEKTITILIEQPELHLHPAMQAQLADAFIYAIELAKENQIELKLIVETHSSVIINRIGRRVIDKSIATESVNVTLFELDAELKNSIVKTTGFNNKGVLIDWPLGFFEPKK